MMSYMLVGVFKSEKGEPRLGLVKAEKVDDFVNSLKEIKKEGTAISVMAISGSVLPMAEDMSSIRICKSEYPLVDMKEPTFVDSDFVNCDGGKK